MAVFRPDPDGLTPEMREAMSASEDLVGDMFPPDTYFSEREVELARDQVKAAEPRP